MFSYENIEFKEILYQEAKRKEIELTKEQLKQLLLMLD